MRTLCSKGLLIAVVALLLAFGGGMRGDAAAAQSEASGAAAWLDSAVLQKHCPRQPVNVPAALLQTSDAALRRRVSIVGDALRIGGTAGPDHILVRTGGAPNLVRVWLDGRFLGSFGPVARIVVQGGGGNDVVIVGPKVELPARIEGGAGDDCLEGGGGGDQLFGGNGNDVLIAGTGRPAPDLGTGNDRIIVPQRMGELRVTPSAAGQLLPLLSRIYRLRSISQGSGPPAGQAAAPNPIVLGPADLREPGIAPLLQQTYDAGQAVALTDATAADAARLRRLLGQPNAVQGPAPGKRAALIFFRKASRPGTKAFDYATGIFSQAPTPASPAASRRSDEQNIALLSRVFSATAIVPEARAGVPSDDLLQLADSYTTSNIARNVYGGSVQLVNSVWNVRSFLNHADFYYVLQEADYFFSPPQSGIFPPVIWDNTTASGLGMIGAMPTLIQPSPASTQCETSTTSGVSFEIGGSAGWNQEGGVNAGVTGGVRIDNSKTVTCPSVRITNQSDPTTGVSAWEYFAAPPSSPNLTSFFNQWVWEVPFSSYSKGQQSATVVSSGISDLQPCFSGRCLITNQMTSEVPLPFGDTFALQKPTVASATPACVGPGSSFAIAGTGFYPSLVTGVLIGGTPLSSAQFTATSDMVINAVAPSQSGKNLPVVVQTAEGLSNADVTIKIGKCGS